MKGDGGGGGGRYPHKKKKSRKDMTNLPDDYEKKKNGTFKNSVQIGTIQLHLTALTSV